MREIISDGKDRCVREIIAQKQVKVVAIISVLQKSWEIFGTVRMNEATDRVMLFEFDNKDTREQIFDMVGRRTLPNHKEVDPECGINQDRIPDGSVLGTNT